MEIVHRKIFGFLMFLLMIVLGACFNQIGLKTLSIIAVFGTLFTILYVSLETALFFIIVFIWFQGFFKIISNYHPVVHVGADLVVIALVFKALFVGIKKYKEPPPFVKLFGIHFCWIAVMFFNPYSLSLVSNIAGSKIYISMFLLYFFGYYLTNSLSDVKKLFILFISLALIQTGFTLYQGYYGPDSVLKIHPGYALQLNKFIGYAFRPFGLTHIPGGPSVYIYMMIPFVAYFIIENRSKILKLLNILFLPLFGMALIFCQVRSAIGKSIFSIAFFILAINSSRITISFKNKIFYNFGAVLAGSFTIWAMVHLMNFSVEAREDNEMSIDRSLSTFDMSAMSVARRGALERFFHYAQEVPFGAGFSRVGAAAGAFQNELKSDKMFRSDHFFSDNLFIHLLIEIGFPGLIFVSLIVGSIIFSGLKMVWNEKRQNLIGPQVAILSAIFAIAVGSYGAEGIVYNPESCFFWLFSGVLMSMRRPDFDTQDLE